LQYDVGLQQAAFKSKVDHPQMHAFTYVR